VRSGVGAGTIATRWAGRPAASWPTVTRPNAPSPLAEQLGSVNAAAQELGTTWPSLRKAFSRQGLGMPARNPEAVRRRSGQPATPPLDPVFVALTAASSRLHAAPRRAGPAPRRAEEIEMLSYRTVVELNAESRLAPHWRAATITRRAQRPQRLASDRTTRADRRQVERATRTDRSQRPSRPHPQPKERGMLTDGQ
jgi:hypothetical protein